MQIVVLLIVEFVIMRINTRFFRFHAVIYNKPFGQHVKINGQGLEIHPTVYNISAKYFSTTPNPERFLSYRLKLPLPHCLPTRKHLTKVDVVELRGSCIPTQSKSAVGAPKTMRLYILNMP